MLLDMAWSQSKQSSAVGNWTTPLHTPSTAMTWNAFFLKGETRKNVQKGLDKTGTDQVKPLRTHLGIFM